LTDSEPVKTVALFVTCLVDLYRPDVGFAAVRLLEQAGFDVSVPDQGCCGQSNFNSGDRDGARQMATGIIERFSGYDYVVTPSGSCAAMIRRHYPALFDEESQGREAALALAEKTWELTSFLVDRAGLETVEATLDASVTYHDACSGFHELGIREQPRRLLSSVSGLELQEMEQSDQCCGFGGLFCIKYPQISNRIVESKLDAIRATGADYVVAGDVGCMMQIEGKLHRLGETQIRVVHVAEILADSLADTLAGNSDADD